MVPDDWNAVWQPRHQILSRLARHFHVAWVSPARKWRRIVTEGRWRPGPEQPEAFPGLSVYESHAGWPWVEHPAALDAWLFAQRVRAARRSLARRGCRRFVLMLWLPRYAGAIGAAPFDLTCYYIDDEYSWSEIETPIPDDERDLIRTVDQVFIHSPALREKKGGINPRTTFAPNGVDYASYATACPEPADLRTIGHPRVGYAGILKLELDWSLLADLSRRHTDWSFVFVGPLKASQTGRLAGAAQDLFGQPNVHWLGPKSVSELPAYQQHFDVAILPYRRNAYTKYIYPLKLHEALAAGPPVVGSRIRTLDDFSDVVQLAETGDDWSSALRAALGPDANTEAARVARQRVAQRHDWDILVQRIAETITDVLASLAPGREANPTVRPR